MSFNFGKITVADITLKEVVVPPFSVPVPPAFTVSPAITGTEIVGSDLTLSLGAVDSGTITGVLDRDGTTIIASVTDGQTYTLLEADEGAVLTLTATATNDQGSTTASDSTGTITYAAPVAAGALADQLVQVSTGVQTFDASGDFTVTGDADLSGVTWSLPTAPSGVSIDTDGIVSIDTETTGLLDGSTVTVRATNSGGSDDSGLSLTVADVPDAFVSGDWSVDGSGDVTISALPADNFDDLTDIEYRIDGGTAQSFGATATGTYSTGASPGEDVEIRAVNSLGAGAWSDTKAVPLPFPQNLFTADESGFVIDAYDSGSLYQDDAGTTVASSDGDPVGLWQDTSTSTNGVDHDAAGAVRPEFKDDGTYKWIEGDGVDDEMESVTDLDMNGTDVQTFVFAVKSIDTSGDDARIFSHIANDSDNRKILYAPRTSSVDIRAFNPAGGRNYFVDANGPSYEPPNDLVIRYENDIPNDTMKLWVNGTFIGSETSGHNDGGIGPSMLFRSGLIGIYRGFGIARALTSQEAADADDWAADGNSVTI